LIEWKVPLADIELGEEAIEAVTSVLRSNWLSMGPVAAEFERRFAEYLGVKYTFAVANGTAALHLAHLSLGVGLGDKIICPSLTFVATANAIRYTGATPIFADITSLDNLNISPEDIEAKVDENTKGICVVHYGGYPCDMEKITEIAKRHNLYVVEDAAHAPGASCWITDEKASHNKKRGEKFLKKCGSIGDIGCFSFFSNKNMTTGEGGMIVTNRDDLAERVKFLRSHGMTSLTWDRYKGHSFSYDVIDLGFNYRMDELRSALGLIQLKKLDKNNHKRNYISGSYRNKLSSLNGIDIPFANFEGKSSHHIFPILLPSNSYRNKLMAHLKTHGIQTSIHYPPIHLFSYYKRLCPYQRLSLTEEVAGRKLTLPLYPTMDKDNVDYVVETIRRYLTNTTMESIG
jgi:dTDP-4-amino-4,6-dideoxygalactose transaminase